MRTALKWEAGFITRYLSEGERHSELLFGLIMTLTFTLTAGFVVGEDRSAVRELLLATIGCNVAWGIIDAGLLILNRAFDRGRAKRIGMAIRKTDDSESTQEMIATELDETLAPLTTPESRRRLYGEIAELIQRSPPRRTGVRREDWGAAHAVFWLVVAASVPAALPFVFINEPWLALRVSNGILLVLFFVLGYRWAAYTSIPPWRAATSVTLFGVAMVLIAIALGG